jgi:hypothetical protein
VDAATGTSVALVSAKPVPSSCGLTAQPPSSVLPKLVSNHPDPHHISSFVEPGCNSQSGCALQLNSNVKYEREQQRRFWPQLCEVGWHRCNCWLGRLRYSRPCSMVPVLSATRKQLMKVEHWDATTRPLRNRRCDLAIRVGLGRWGAAAAERKNLYLTAQISTYTLRNFINIILMRLRVT